MAAGVLWLLRLKQCQAGFRGEPFSQAGWRAVAAALALVGPALAAELAGRYVSAENATFAMSLVPVVVAVTASALGVIPQGEMTGRLWPGLAGLGALLLLLPQPAMDGWRFLAALTAMPMLAGIGSVYAARQKVQTEFAARRKSSPSWQVSGLLISTAVLAAVAISGRRAEPLSLSPLAVAIDGLTFLLSILVLGRLGATRWSAQFLVIPTMTLLEGIVVVRPALDLRTCAALVLLLASSAYLLLFRKAAPVSITTVGHEP